MPAFVFANIASVTDPERFGKHHGEAGATVTKCGGKILGGGSKIEIADGDWLPVGEGHASRLLLMARDVRGRENDTCT